MPAVQIDANEVNMFCRISGISWLFIAAGIVLCGLSLSACRPAPTLSPTDTPTAPAAVTEPAVTATPTPAPLTPLPTATPTNTPTPVIYVVKPGDNLIAIARIYGVTVEAIQEANGILDPRRLQIGQELIIPMDESALRTPPTPTPTPLPFTIAGVNFQRSPSGVLWCLGEVENTAGVDLEQVQVGVSLFDEKGQLLAFTTAFVELDVLPHGAKAPFAASFDNPPERFATYQSVPLRGLPLSHPETYYLDLEVSNLAGEGRGHASYHIAGRVRNIGDETAARVRLVVTAYTEEGKVAGVRKVAPAQDTLAPGRSSDFEVHLLSTAGSVVTYTVRAEALRQSLTPTPTPQE
jgi:LysM repeat protein